MARIPRMVIGDETMIANLGRYKGKMTNQIADGLRKFGGEIERVSTTKCPIEFGELRSRVFNEGPLQEKDTQVQVVGYEKFGATWGDGRAYAIPVHERTGVAHKVGEAKFLQHAVDECSKDYVPYMQKLLGQVRL
ncbi:MAG: hypothetical protein WC277_13045 [Bacilli bacterium]